MSLIVGLDTEYTKHVAEFVLPETCNKRNRVLSYQLWFLDTETGNQGGLVIPILNGHKISGRLTLASLLTKGFEYAIRNGTIKKLPDKIILTAHFWRADLPSLKDFSKLKRKLDTVRNTYVSAKQPFIQQIYIHGRKRRLSIKIVDTMLLAPAGHQSLAALGDMLGIEKIDLPNGVIERMDTLQRDDPELFDKYALRDAEIAARWVQLMLEFFADDLGLATTNLPITLGSAAVKMFTDGLDEAKLNVLLGTKNSAVLSDLTSFQANCYHGGRNEAFAVGYHEAHLTDIDLSGAYTTAMAGIRYPDWGGLVETTEINTLANPDALCIARVYFKFPSTTRYPSLPVRAGDQGLIYPLEGEACCTGAELRVALNRGATIQVLKGVYVPWLNDERPFAEFTKTTNRLRKKYPKGTVLERVAKEIGNSLYGKVAQGVANMRGITHEIAKSSGKRRHFSSRDGRMQDLEPCKITQPLLAAFITGMVRAVLSEMLASLPPEAHLLTATTDGFLSDVEVGQLDMSGPLITLFSELREIVSDSPNPIEEKGEAAEAIVFKTRGCFATKPLDPENPGKPILARAGNKLENKLADPWEECRLWEEIYKTRSFDTKHSRRQMIDLKSQWQKDADLTDEPRDVRVNMDYDLKRRPVDVVDVKGLVHFATEPWQTIGQFYEWREAFDKWRVKKKRVLRKAQDWADFASHKKLVFQKAESGVRTSKRPPIVQLFLRCYAHGELGFSGKDFAAAASFVTECGWPTTVQNVKDAKRRGSVKLGTISELTSDEQEFLSKAVKRWPDFDCQMLFKSGG